jgi:hypothetical protein
MKDSTGRAMASRNGQELNGFWNGRVRKDPHRGKKNRVLQEKTALNLPEKLMAPGWDTTNSDEKEIIAGFSVLIRRSA